MTDGPHIPWTSSSIEELFYLGVGHLNNNSVLNHSGKGEHLNKLFGTELSCGKNTVDYFHRTGHFALFAKLFALALDLYRFFSV